MLVKTLTTKKPPFRYISIIFGLLPITSTRARPRSKRSTLRRWQKCPESQSYEIFCTDTSSHKSRLLRRDGGLLLPSFPNVTIIALRIQQTIGISNCEGEHSFSTLSHVKNHLRATTSQYRLDHLAVMSIESDLLRALDVTTLIDEFAHESENQQQQF